MQECNLLGCLPKLFKFYKSWKPLKLMILNEPLSNYKTNFRPNAEAEILWITNQTQLQRSQNLITPSKAITNIQFSNPTIHTLSVLVKTFRLAKYDSFSYIQKRHSDGFPESVFKQLFPKKQKQNLFPTSCTVSEEPWLKSCAWC